MSRCLMLASPVYTPISLDGIVNSDDLKPSWSKTGLTEDHHITIVYDKDGVIDQNAILDDLKSILKSDYEVFMKFLEDDHQFRVDGMFDLEVFDTDEYDYLVLVLRRNNELYKILNRSQEGLRKSYEITSDYPEYKAHITLAELVPGSGAKYLENEDLKKVLRDSTVSFEDLVFSMHNKTDVKEVVWSITTFHTLERLFREY